MKRGKGSVGRTVRVIGERGDFRLAAINSEGLYEVCRVKPGRGGKCVEFVLRRDQFRFVRHNYEAAA